MCKKLFNVGDKVKIPKTKNSDIGTPLHKSSAILNAKEINQDFLYVLQNNHPEYVLGVDLRSWDSTFHFQDLEHYEEEFVLPERKIIGYKLIKPEYEGALKNIKPFWDKEIHENDGYNVAIESGAYYTFKEAGVLDIWFDPVYEEEFKVGDLVTITELRKDPTGGLHAKFRKATPEEIEARKSQETHPYSEEFFDWIDKEEIPREDGKWIKYFNGKDNYLTTKELLQLWKDQKSKTVVGQREQLFCTMTGKGFCPYENKDGSCNMKDGNCLNHKESEK